MRVRFIHEKHPAEHVAEVFGEKFPKNEWVKIDHLEPEIRQALANNPTFEVEVEAKAEAAVDTVADAVEAVAEDAAEAAPEPSYEPTWPDDPPTATAAEPKADGLNRT